MSMSTHIEGFRPPDDRWYQMQAIYDACTKAGIEIPEEVKSFFSGEPPDPAGIRVDLMLYRRQYTAEGSVGFELNVADIPEHVTVIRFYNSW